MFKTAENNIFVVGNAIYHFNGSDWKEFTEFRKLGVGWNGCYSDGKEVFIIGNDNNNNNTVILHGK